MLYEIKWKWMTRRMVWRDAKLKLAIRLARRLPTRIRYAVVIVETTDYSERHREAEVPAITAFDIARDIYPQIPA